jgi:hypothetical protein
MWKVNTLTLPRQGFVLHLHFASGSPAPTALQSRHALNLGLSPFVIGGQVYNGYYVQ